MTTIKTTRITIERVEQIEVENLLDYSEELDFTERAITVWTEDGEQYELILVAHTPEQLEFAKRDKWLKPKLYQPIDE